MKKNNSKLKKRVCAVACTVATTSMVLANTMSVYATDSTGIPIVDNGMNVIKVLAIGFVEIIGVIGMAKGGMTIGTGVSQRDTSGIIQGAAEFGGGLIMAGIGVLIGLLGF